MKDVQSTILPLHVSVSSTMLAKKNLRLGPSDKLKMILLNSILLLVLKFLIEELEKMRSSDLQIHSYAKSPSERMLWDTKVRLKLELQIAITFL